MTDVNQLPAGRKLDAKVAEVMGWTRIHQMGSGDFCGVPPRDTPPHVLPCYSTDIAAAFQVVDELLDGTRTFALECWDLDTCRWHVMFRGQLNKEATQYERLDSAWAQTIPLAICHAALEVVRKGENACES